jgi:transcriptional regulator with XRE-family HTH domain
MLGVGRLTLLQIEADKRQVKADELKKLSQIFDVSVDFLLSDTPKIQPIKVNTQQKKKFEQLLLYILSKVGGKHNVGKVVLYKLLYFAEFDYHELYPENYLSGYPFIKLPMGPAPYNFNELVSTMEEEKSVATMIVPYFNQYQQRFVANVPVEPDKRFTKEEKACIDDVIERYSDLPANVISDLSHKDKPWQLSEDMGVILYNTVKFREEPFSPLAREEKKKQTQAYAKSTGFFSDLADEPDVYEEYR